MAVDVILPKLAMTMEEGTLLRWRVSEGQRVEQGQVLFDVGTDKVDMEVEAPASGIIRGICVAEGERVPVGTHLAWIVAEGEAVPSPAPAAEGEPVRASPAARRLAREAGMELSSIRGRGPGGRIEVQDVEEAIAASRRAVAAHMERSARTAPQVTLVVRVDMTEATRVVEELRPELEAQTGARLGYHELVLKAVAAALVRHPRLNAWYTDHGLEVQPDVHLGIAVAVGDGSGLVVPVLRNAHRMGLSELLVAAKGLAQRAREGKLSAGDTAGATFTVTNLGPWGVLAFNPLLVVPQVGILGVGVVEPAPVSGRPQVMLSLTFDHRAMDGAPAAAFLAEVKGFLERPYRLLS